MWSYHGLSLKTKEENMVWMIDVILSWIISKDKGRRSGMNDMFRWLHWWYDFTWPFSVNMIRVGRFSFIWVQHLLLPMHCTCCYLNFELFAFHFEQRKMKVSSFNAFDVFVVKCVHRYIVIKNILGVLIHSWEERMSHTWSQCYALKKFQRSKDP